jgi:hypothetical protein
LAPAAFCSIERSNAKPAGNGRRAQRRCDGGG